MIFYAEASIVALGRDDLYLCEDGDIILLENDDEAQREDFNITVAAVTSHNTSSEITSSVTLSSSPQINLLAASVVVAGAELIGQGGITRSGEANIVAGAEMNDQGGITHSGEANIVALGQEDFNITVAAVTSHNTSGEITSSVTLSSSPQINLLAASVVVAGAELIGQGGITHSGEANIVALGRDDLYLFEDGDIILLENDDEAQREDFNITVAAVTSHNTSSEITSSVTLSSSPQINLLAASVVVAGAELIGQGGVTHSGEASIVALGQEDFNITVAAVTSHNTSSEITSSVTLSSSPQINLLAASVVVAGAELIGQGGIIRSGEANIVAGESVLYNVLLENNNEFITEYGDEVVLERLNLFDRGLNSMTLGYMTLNSSNYIDMTIQHQLQVISTVIHNDDPLDINQTVHVQADSHHDAFGLGVINTNIYIINELYMSADALATFECAGASIIAGEVEHFSASIILSGATMQAGILALQCTTNVLTREERGYWEGTDGFLSSNMYLQDNHYYQDYSYEIECNTSIHHYRDTVTDLIHPSGTKMFGKYVWTSEITNNFELTVDSYVEYEILDVDVMTGMSDVDTIPLNIVRIVFGDAHINPSCALDALSYRNIYLDGSVNGEAVLGEFSSINLENNDTIQLEGNDDTIESEKESIDVYVKRFGYGNITSTLNDVDASLSSILYASADIENTIGPSMSVLADDTVIQYSVSIILAGASVTASSEVSAGFGQGMLNQAPLDTWTLNGHFGTRDAILTEDGKTVITEMADILINEEVN